ncbi:MAG: EVE domain-containing protein [Candidatus Gracilibacteria bacterium]
MNYWLVKTEPSTFSYSDLEKDKKAVWDGVRNYQARNNLKLMKKGDQVFVYHSVDQKAIVGIAEVSKEYYPDPTIDDDRWVVVEIVPVRAAKTPITLDQIKSAKGLENMVVVRNSRLSVQPVKKEEFDAILKMGV